MGCKNLPFAYSFLLSIKPSILSVRDLMEGGGGKVSFIHPPRFLHFLYNILCTLKPSLPEENIPTGPPLPTLWVGKS